MDGYLKQPNIPGTICSINFTSIDRDIFIENIPKSINRNKVVANLTKNIVTKPRAEKATKGCRWYILDNRSIIQMFETSVLFNLMHIIKKH